MGSTMRWTGVTVCVLLLLMDTTPLYQASPIHLPTASEDRHSAHDPLREHRGVPWDDSASSPPGGSPSHPEQPSLLPHISGRQKMFEAGLSNHKDRKKDLLYNTVSATLTQAVKLPERKAAHPSRSSKISERSVEKTVEEVFGQLPSSAMFLPAEATPEEREQVWRESVKMDEIKRQFYSLQRMFINAYNNINKQIGSLGARPGSRKRSKRSGSSLEDIFMPLPEGAMFIPHDASEEEREASLRSAQRTQDIKDQFYSLQRAFTNMYNSILTQLSALPARSRSQQRSKRSGSSRDDGFSIEPLNAMFHPTEYKRQETVNVIAEAVKEVRRPPSSTTSLRVDASREAGGAPSGGKPSKGGPGWEQVHPVTETLEDVVQRLPSSTTSLPVGASEQERGGRQESATVIQQFHGLWKIYAKMYEWICQRTTVLRDPPATGDAPGIRKCDASRIAPYLTLSRPVA